MQLLADGYSALVIAAELGITVSAVTLHLRRVFVKLGVRSKVEAIVYAMRHGLIE